MPQLPHSKYAQAPPPNNQTNNKQLNKTTNKLNLIRKIQNNQKK